MKLENLLRAASAMHHSYMVATPFRQRGGLLLVSAPGNMKSTIVESVCRPFPNALRYSDLTLKQLSVIRSQIASETYVTLGFLELEKIYSRQSPVALNFEGVLKAMVEEGFAHFAFEDSRCWVPTARCFVIASVLDNLYRYHFPRWKENGFLRRFIIFKYSLTRAAKKQMKDALHEGRLLELPEQSMYVPRTTLSMDCTATESRKLETILASDEEIYTPLNLLRRTLVILKWMYKQDKNRRKALTPMECLEDLKAGISPEGGFLDI